MIMPLVVFCVMNEWVATREVFAVENLYLSFGKLSIVLFISQPNTDTCMK